MKLVIAVVQDKDSGKLAQNLVKENIRATKLASTGGFLHAGNTTFMIGTEDDNVDAVKDIIRQSCKARDQVVAPMSPIGANMESYIPYPVNVQVGGATVFVLDIEQFDQF